MRVLLILTFLLLGLGVAADVGPAPESPGEVRGGVSRMCAVGLLLVVGGGIAGDSEIVQGGLQWVGLFC